MPTIVTPELLARQPQAPAIVPAATRRRVLTPRARPVAELQDALAQSRIRTRYQPLVSMRDGGVTGFEVLARLEHPLRGLLGPDQFVPQLEGAGLGVPLTKAVIRRAFADWAKGGLASHGHWLALNFPLDVLVSAATTHWLDEQREHYGIGAHEIVLELTESRPIQRLGILERAVCDLRGRGYGIAIDDVSPATRHYKPLAGLPFTMLKLDRELVASHLANQQHAEFLAEALAAARTDGLSVVAEGVEDAAGWNQMQSLAIDQVQGYFVARPMPAVAVSTWARDWRSGERLLHVASG